MNGKSKCKILKQIRREIARQNDIEYVTSECKFQGNCTGTCPKCEAELRYLESELEKRRNAGKTVAVAGIAAAMLLSATGCRPGRTESQQPEAVQTEDPRQTQGTEMEIQGGLIDPGLLLGETEPLMGEPVETTAGVPVEPLMGDVPLDTGEFPEG